MQNWKLPSYRIFSVVYALLLALILTVVIRISTHQGFVLGIVAVLTGLILIERSFKTSSEALMLNGIVFVVLEIIACIVVLINRDLAELWFASFYAIFSILLVAERIVRRLYS